MTSTCPQCGRPAKGYAFTTTTNYVRCSLGHGWPNPEIRSQSNGTDPTGPVKSQKETA